jgi:transposase
MRAIRKSYMSDMTDEQWELLKGFIPAAKAGGRPRKVEIREIVNAIFYILSAGCPWRMLPHDFPVWQTVYEYFRNCGCNRAEVSSACVAPSRRMEKIWEPINRQFNQWVRVSGGKDATPSVGIVDSQSVQISSTQSEPQAVGCDGGKKVKGRKRQILVDTWGLLMVVVVTAANMAEREGAKLVLAKSHSHYPRLFKILADAGDDGAPMLQWVMDTYHWIWETVKRTDKAVGFVPLPQRWVVERTFGWFNWSRRLSKDYEILTDTSEAFLYIAMIRLSLRRLA